MGNNMELIFLFIGLALGFLIAYLLFKANNKNSTGINTDEYNTLLKDFDSLKIDSAKKEQIVFQLKEANDNFNKELEQLRKKEIELNSLLSRSSAENQNLVEKLSEQKKEMEELHEKFTIQFKNLANEILEDKSKKFTEQNKTNLDEILRPLNDKIKDFEKRVIETYDKESKERFSLQNEIKNLYELNQQMSKEANNLTNALKGDSQKQGAWGELVLERILENSGLERGREFEIQETFVDEEGTRLRPDVIIKLPENKVLIIDSKVSLTAYERYCSTDDELEKQKFLKEHLTSIKNHIKGLSEKKYQNINQVNTPDFILLFIPLDPAFNLAVQNELSLYDEAFQKNIVIISATTLMATLKIIANIWKQEKQNRNALEIAKQGGALYDKIVLFIKDLEELGKKLKSTNDSYDEAMKKLSFGSGNILKRTENLKKLGAKATKSLPLHLMDETNETDNLTDEENI